jgi:hypothetical protein
MGKGEQAPKTGLDHDGHGKFTQKRLRLKWVKKVKQSHHLYSWLLYASLLSVYLLQPKITSITLSRSSWLIAVPEGKQSPRLNKSSATSPFTHFYPACLVKFRRII